MLERERADLVTRPSQLFTVPIRKDPWPDNPVSDLKCAVCRRFWRPFVGSYLSGHARCIWTREAALWLFRETRPTPVLAKEIGVTLHVVLAGIKAGRGYAEDLTREEA